MPVRREKPELPGVNALIGQFAPDSCFVAAAAEICAACQKQGDEYPDVAKSKACAECREIGG